MVSTAADAADVGRLQRRMSRTRAAIVRAAEELFSAQGFGETTTEQIAARADVAPRTFFRYFPTKESVLFADASEKREQLLAELEARPADEHPFASLVAVLRQFAAEVEGDVDAFELRQRISAEHPSVREYERTLLECEFGDPVASFVADRLGVDVDADTRPRLWAVLAMATFRVAYQVWMSQGKQGTLPEAVEHAMAAAAEAIAAVPSA